MVIKKEMKDLLGRWIVNEIVQVHVGGSEIDIQILDHRTKISLASNVYDGKNFLPKSVRQGAAGKAPFSGGLITTTLEIDEQNFQINLTYIGLFHENNHQELKDLLEEFSWQADEWRLSLDEHDRNDLVPIRVKL